MTQIFGIPLDILTTILVSITVVIVVGVLLLALTNKIFFKIGVRNIPRRRLQMLLIVFALMLSTTLLSSVLATGDVITAAVQSVSTYNNGNIDEIIEGGRSPRGLYRDGVYYSLLDRNKHNTDIAAIGAALREQSILVADQTSRQVRSNVTALGVIPGSEQGFGGMQDLNSKKHFTIASLTTNQVYLNQTAAQLLNAHAGDTLYLYAQRWSGKRYTMHIVGIVQNGGLVGDNPFLLSNVQTFQNIEGDGDAISQVFIANRGGVGASDSVTETLNHQLFGGVHVIQVKQQGVTNSQNAQDIFSRIFGLFSLFALAIGLLLIFLIFILLAAERRAEMGMARAIGVQRRHLILMFLFEGAIYDVLSSIVGLASGIGIGALLVIFLGPILVRFNFPLKLTFQPRSLIIAYCLGVIFTFCSVAISSWLVSRMTIVEAMRDLPEPGHYALSLGELGVRLLDLLKQLGQALTKRPHANLRRSRRILLEHIPDTLLGFVRSLVTLGFLPLFAGYWLTQFGLEQALIIPFSLGLSLLVVGSGLLLKAVLLQIYSIGTDLLQRKITKDLREEMSVGTDLSRPSNISSANKDVINRSLQTLNTSIKKPVVPDRVQRIDAVSKLLNRIVSTLIALAIAAYWALPFDALANFGLPRFQGGIEVFFVAGMMMVMGTVWAIVVNAELIVGPLLALCSRFPGIYAMTRLASAYPLHRRLRTGLNVIMFSLVVFAMTVMAIITNATQSTYADINTQTGGYDIQATAYFKPLQNINTSLAQHGINPNVFSSIGVRNTTVVGMIQPSADTPRWSLYPAQVVSGGFLQGNGLHLAARAKGFQSDAAVWQALQSHPNYALIDSSALPYNPNTVSSSGVYDPTAPSANAAGAPTTPPGFDVSYTFAVNGVYQGDTSFAAVPVWVTGLSIKQSVKLTIIGVVDNSDNSHFGLYIPRSAYSSASIAASASDITGIGNTTLDPNAPNAQTYYFKVAPGQDKRALALALGSAYLDDGLETTVLEDAVWSVRGPRILLSDVLLGVVGMTLLLGVAALAITGTRAVIERRQQIGMLRALGCKRRLIQGAFLLESFLVGALGGILGLVLGVLLARNIFAANFFEQFQTGLTFSIPWNQLAIIVGVALLASFLGAVLPSWQAGKIAPAEALRY